MPRGDYKTCRECGRHADEVGELSHTRRCEACSARLKIEGITQLHEHRGPVFDLWRVRIAASVGAVIPEKGN